MKILDRIKAPTPKFWQKVRNTMITIGAVSGALMAAPGLPLVVASLASYGLTVGTIGAALSQMTVEDKK